MIDLAGAAWSQATGAVNLAGSPWQPCCAARAAEQDFVALRLQLLDGARSDLGMDAVDELLLHFRS